MQALPKALAARGHRVMVIAPRYKNYDNAWETGVRLRLHVFDSDQEVGGKMVFWRVWLLGTLGGSGWVGG
jgi:hypothetical protein